MSETTKTEEKTPEITPEQKPVVPPMVETKNPEPVGQKATVDQGQPAHEPTKLLTDDVDDESIEKYTDKHGNVTLPYKAFKSRISRATKKALNEVFGTDDRAEIIKRKEAYEALLTKQEQERRAKLDELTREKEDRKKLEEERDALRKQLENRERAEQVKETDGELRKAASEHVASEYEDFALDAFKKHVAKLSDDEIDGLSSKDVDAWFKAWAEKKPAMRKSPPEPEKRPISNGAQTGNRPSPSSASTALSGKTPRPGQPNSMTSQELAMYKRHRGLHY